MFESQTVRSQTPTKTWSRQGAQGQEGRTAPERPGSPKPVFMGVDLAGPSSIAPLPGHHTGLPSLPQLTTDVPTEREQSSGRTQFLFPVSFKLRACLFTPRISPGHSGLRPCPRPSPWPSANLRDSIPVWSLKSVDVLVNQPSSARLQSSPGRTQPSLHPHCAASFGRRWTVLGASSQTWPGVPLTASSLGRMATDAGMSPLISS